MEELRCAGTLEAVEPQLVPGSPRYRSWQSDEVPVGLDPRAQLTDSFICLEAASSKNLLRGSERKTEAGETVRMY